MIWTRTQTEQLSSLAHGVGGKSPRILLLHGAGWANVGDNAMMYAALRRLERVIPGCLVIVAKLYEEEDASVWADHESAAAPHLYVRRPLGRAGRWGMSVLRAVGLRSVARALRLCVVLSRAGRLVLAARVRRAWGFTPLGRLGREVLDVIRCCDGMYCSGGGNLNDVWLEGELVPRVTAYRLAHIFGKPVVLSGQQIGPLTSRLGKWLLRWGVSVVDSIACRDHAESRAFLLGLGLDDGRVVSLGDDAVDLCTAGRARAAEIRASEGVPPGSDVVAVHVRLHNFSEGFRGPAVPVLAAMLDQLVQRFAVRILFVPVSYAQRRSYDADIGDAFEVYTRMGARDRAHFLSRERYTPPDFKSVVGSCRFLIGFSYHAWVFALTSDVPAFGLYYGEYYRMKAEGLFAFYDRGQWTWDLAAEDPTSALLSTVENVLAGYDEHVAQLRAVNERLCDDVAYPARRLRALIGAAPDHAALGGGAA